MGGREDGNEGKEEMQWGKCEKTVRRGEKRKEWEEREGGKEGERR